MQPDQLTYQWLVPILLGALALTIGVIGKGIIGYLSLLSTDISEMRKDLKESNEEMRKSNEANNKEHHGFDLRLTKIEEHIPG